MRAIAVTSALSLTVLLALPGCGSSASTAKTVLTNVDWQWTVLTVTTPASQTAVADPARYTISFEGDGRVQVKADCNSGSGTYHTNGPSMTIDVGVLTRAACPTGSLSDDYVRDLGAVTSYVLEDGRLALQLKDEGGEMRFLDASVAPTTTGS